MMVDKDETAGDGPDAVPPASPPIAPALLSQRNGKQTEATPKSAETGGVPAKGFALAMIAGVIFWALLFYVLKVIFQFSSV